MSWYGFIILCFVMCSSAHGSSVKGIEDRLCHLDTAAYLERHQITAEQLIVVPVPHFYIDNQHDLHICDSATPHHGDHESGLCYHQCRRTFRTRTLPIFIEHAYKQVGHALQSQHHNTQTPTYSLACKGLLTYQVAR